MGDAGTVSAWRLEVVAKAAAEAVKELRIGLREADALRGTGRYPKATGHLSAVVQVAIIRLEIIAESCPVEGPGDDEPPDEENRDRADQDNDRGECEGAR